MLYEYNLESKDIQKVGLNEVKKKYFGSTYTLVFVGVAFGQPDRLEGLQGLMVADCMLSVYSLFSSCDREQFLMSTIKGAAKTTKSNMYL